MNARSLANLSVGWVSDRCRNTGVTLSLTGSQSFMPFVAEVLTIDLSGGLETDA